MSSDDEFELGPSSRAQHDDACVAAASARSAALALATSRLQAAPQLRTLLGGLPDLEVPPPPLSLDAWHDSLAVIEHGRAASATMGAKGADVFSEAAALALSRDLEERLRRRRVREADERRLVGDLSRRLLDAQNALIQAAQAARAARLAVSSPAGDGEAVPAAPGSPRASGPSAAEPPGLQRFKLDLTLLRDVLKPLMPTPAGEAESEAHAARAEAAFARDIRGLVRVGRVPEATRFLRRYVLTLLRVSRGELLALGGPIAAPVFAQGRAGPDATPVPNRTLRPVAGAAGALRRTQSAFESGFVAGSGSADVAVVLGLAQPGSKRYGSASAGGSVSGRSRSGTAGSSNSVMGGGGERRDRGSSVSSLTDIVASVGVSVVGAAVALSPRASLAEAVGGGGLTVRVGSSKPASAMDRVRALSTAVGEHSAGVRAAQWAEVMRTVYAGVVRTAGLPPVPGGPPATRVQAGALASGGGGLGSPGGAAASPGAPFSSPPGVGRRVMPASGERGPFLTPGSSALLSRGVLPPAPPSTLASAVLDVRCYASLLTRALNGRLPYLTSLPVGEGPEGGSVNLSPALGRAVEEGLHVLVYDTLLAVCAAAAGPAEAEAASLMSGGGQPPSDDVNSNVGWPLHTAPPCVYGLSHVWCAPHERGCALATPACGRGEGTCAPPRGSAASLARAVYAPALAALAAFAASARSPYGKLTALRAALTAITAGAAVEKSLGKAMVDEARGEEEEGGQEQTPAPAHVEASGSEEPREPSSRPSAGAARRAAWAAQSAVSAAAVPVPVPSPAFDTTAVGADDLMPRLCFVLAGVWDTGKPGGGGGGLGSPRALFTRPGGPSSPGNRSEGVDMAPPGPLLLRPLAQLAYVEETCPADRVLGEDGYALVSLRGAAMHTLSIARGGGRE